MDPVSATLIVGSTVASAGSSYAAARQQNAAARRSAQSAADADLIRRRQLQAQADLEKQKRIDEARQIAGRIRVVSAERGVGSGGSAAALERQNAIDLSTNQGVIEQNLAAGLLSSGQSLEAQLAQLSAATRNPLLETFLGGLQGAGTGLSIAGGVLDLQERIK
jgi:hypothetical protein